MTYIHAGNVQCAVGSCLACSYKGGRLRFSALSKSSNYNTVVHKYIHNNDSC
jgi:hypothetical protein